MTWCWRFLLLFLSVIGLAGCTPDPNSTDVAENGAALSGHQLMVERLAFVGQQSFRVNEYFETASLEADQRRLAAANPRATQERFIAEYLVSGGHRRLGKIELATQHIDAAASLLDDVRPSLSPVQIREFLFQAGVTYLRLAETQNCVHCETGESCILPIRGSGVHQARVGSERAIEFFQQVLAINPNDLEAQWLMNIAYMTLDEHPTAVPPEFLIPTTAFESLASFSRFQEIGLQAGIKTISCGGGAISEDFDGDGWLDWMNSPWSPDGSIMLFRNQRDGTFEDISSDTGLAGIVGGINMVQGDFDNDGDPDVYVTRGAWLAEAGRVPNSLLENLGNGKFLDVTVEKGLVAEFPTPTAAWADFDNDGDLDIYVGNESYPSQLYRNDGADGFVDIARDAGVTNDLFTKGAVWGDFDQDRFPDLYVSNLNGPNRLYRNNQDGSFTDVAEQLSVTQPITGFPCWFWDVNNDGYLDIFAASYVIDMAGLVKQAKDDVPAGNPDCIYLGTGSGFREAADEYGLNQVTMPMGANFGDLDNDGFLDFYLGTGYPDYKALMPNLMFHNQNGTKFENVSYSGGFAHVQKGHGASFADFDGDGDQDVFMQMGGAFPGDAFGDVLYENPGFDNHSIRIKLQGSTSNRSAIGARIRADFMDSGEQRSVFRWVNSGGSFGANPLEQHIGLGKANRLERLEIYWPTTDETQVFENLPIDCRLLITEGNTAFETQTR
ncbi:MAG: CRTAC1 family protein [Pirellulaceae bacterium]